MSKVYEYDCHESAEAALARIEANTQGEVWSSEELETRLTAIRKEMTNLKVIIAAWRLAEEQRRAIASSNPIMEETTTETTNKEGDNA